MKQLIRKQMLEKRAAINEAERELLSTKIFDNAVKLFEIENRHLLTFVSMDDEIDTKNFFLYCPKIYVPKCIDKKTMIAVEYSGSEMEKSKFGVMEPVSSVETLGIEVAIVPGLAFDMQGNRIGYGAGFYDRYLKAHPNILKIGVCYDFQIIEDGIKSEIFDVPMDYIVTPQRIIMRDC